MKRFSLAPLPITPERIERAMDRVAEIIVARGDSGRQLLPLYDRLEKMLLTCQAEDEKLAAVRQRFQRSQDRTAGRPS